MAKTSKATGDLDKLQGTWNVTSLEIDGNKMPGVAAMESSITVKGDKFVALGMGATYEGKVTVDEDTKPKLLDMKFSKGPEKGNTSYGIYKLTGDKWTICLTVTAKKRPTKFATSAKSGLALETLERASGAPKKKATADRKSDFADMKFEVIPELEGEWELVLGVRGGVPMDKELVKTGRRVARKNETKISFGGHMMIRTNIVVDTSQTPHAMDYYNIEGMYAGKLMHGIYDIEGGMLRICTAQPGNPRPTDFSATAQNGKSLMVWRKKK